MLPPENSLTNGRFSHGNQQNKKPSQNWHTRVSSQRITLKNKTNKKPLVSDSLTYTKNSKSLIMQMYTKHGKDFTFSTNFLMLAETARETIPYTKTHVWHNERKEKERKVPVSFTSKGGFFFLTNKKIPRPF